VKPSIRGAISSDLPDMMALEKHATTAAHWSARQYESLFNALSAGRVALVIQEKAQQEKTEPGRPAHAVQRVQGFVIGRAVGAEWEIENIAIADQARRRGLGTRLLGEFLGLAKARGAHSVFLEVRETNHPARALYEKWSFTAGGRRKKYYRDPEEDAIVYRLILA
jgi:ribosomal-protein-alanine acetyltransferase